VGYVVIGGSKFYVGYMGNMGQIFMWGTFHAFLARTQKEHSRLKRYKK